MKIQSFLIAILLLLQFIVAGQMKVGDNPTTINSASLLELETNNTNAKGFVFPRVSLTSVSSATPLPSGLLTGTVVYNTNTSVTGGNGIGLYVWRGTAWTPVTPSSGGSGSGWLTTGNSGTSAGTNFIGTTDQQGLVFKVNNVQAGFLGLSASSYATSYGVGASAVFASTAIGAGAQATGSNSSLAVGYNAKSANQNAIAIGTTATVTSDEGIALGLGANTAAFRGVAIGSAAQVSGSTQNIAIGYAANASSFNGIAIGSNAAATTNNSTIAIGVGAQATGFISTGIGNGASATGQNSTAFGSNAKASASGANSFGNFANASGTNSIVIGNISTGSGSNAILIGDQSTAAGDNTIIMGYNSSIGAGISSSILIGDGLTTDQSNVLILGNSAKKVGIGTTTPAYKLTVVPQTDADPLYLGGLQTTPSTTDSFLTISNGVVKRAVRAAVSQPVPAWQLVGNSGTTASNFLGTTDNINLRFRTNNIERMVIDNTGKVGIGITAPPNALSVIATNPLYLSGVQPTSTLTTDSILTIKSGVVKKTPYSSVVPIGGGSSGWSLVGNSDATASSFLGPTDPNVPLVFRVGGLQAGYLGISSSGITTLGVGATAASQQSTSLGTGATATGQNSTALGAGASAGSQQSTALGTGATASSQASLAVGYNAKVTSQNAIAIGSNASTSVDGGIALGFGAIANSQNGVAIGSNAGATTNPNTLALGTGTKATGQNAIAVGNLASAPNIGSEAFGNSANATGANSLVVGNNSTSSGDGAISIGDASTAAGNNSIVLGNNSSVASGTSSAIVIGDNLSTAQSNVLILGNSSKTVGISTTTPNAAAKLDVNGPFKLGVNGSVIDNIIKITVTTSSDIVISQNATTNLTIPGAIVRIGATVIVNPRALNPRTRALPNTVAIGYSYVSARNTVTIDFVTNDNGNATIPTGTRFDITIIQ